MSEQKNVFSIVNVFDGDDMQRYTYFNGQRMPEGAFEALIDVNAFLIKSRFERRAALIVAAIGGFIGGVIACAFL